MSVDVDYYSAAKAAIPILEGAPENCLPLVPVYLDDIGVDGANPSNGEPLAVTRVRRGKSNAQDRALHAAALAPHLQEHPMDRPHVRGHIRDHPYRSPAHKRAAQWVIGNEYPS
ncbi:MAG: hypothetical protein WDN03_03675 [Rhizomicrobium sp.]